MKFKKMKPPKNISHEISGTKLALEIGSESTTAMITVGFSTHKIGPRKAIQMARWLERYAKWSSYQ